MKFCKDCRHLHGAECWHPVNTRTSPVDGKELCDARWTFALSMRTSKNPLDCGPHAIFFSPRLESVA